MAETPIQDPRDLPLGVDVRDVSPQSLAHGDAASAAGAANRGRQASGARSAAASAKRRATGAPIRKDLSLVENLVFAFIFSAVLAALLDRSPLWDHLPDMGGILPARYVSVLETLPVPTNTLLAFGALFAGTVLSLFMLPDPVLGLSGLALSALGPAAYPYGRILWHRIFLQELERSNPGVLDWLLGLAAVGALLAVPILVQTRAILARYQDKGIPRHELRPIGAHLARTAVTRGAIAATFAVTMAILVALPELGTPNRWLLDNSILVLITTGVLLLAAIGFASGIFDRTTSGSGDDRKAPTR